MKSVTLQRALTFRFPHKKCLQVLFLGILNELNICMSSTNGTENDFLRKYCGTESDTCQSGGISMSQNILTKN